MRDAPITGMAKLLTCDAPEPSLLHLAMRLSPEMVDLAPVIMRAAENIACSP